MPDETQIDLSQTVTALRRELDARTAERDEALAREAAITEVLQVINTSPGDLAPVFQTIVEKAHTLCDAASGSLQLWDGKKFRGVAMRGFSEAMMERLRLGYSPTDMPCERIVQGERVVHCRDLAESDSPTARSGVELGGVRTVLYVALRTDGTLLGQIVAVRKEVRPFSETEVALVENFAAQAVIAMENARLLTETLEALEQQTATAGVLQVINSSPGNLAPVFDAVLDKALALCGAAFGVLWRSDGGLVRVAAIRGATPEYADFLTREAYRPDAGSANGRLIAGANIVNQADVADTEDYRSGNQLPRAIVDLGGGRTLLAVALRREETFLGSILIYRCEVLPFADKQIALLQNFAAQAVIAIENARLLTETRESLEQQTATAQVLQVINSSPGNLAPVFDAMLDKALRLCEAAFGILLFRDGSNFQTAALHGVPAALAEFLSGTPREPGKHTAVGRMLDGEDFVHFEDYEERTSLPVGRSSPAGVRRAGRNSDVCRRRAS
jgi:GAF domain-containing protein